MNKMAVSLLLIAVITLECTTLAMQPLTNRALLVTRVRKGSALANTLFIKRRAKVAKHINCTHVAQQLLSAFTHSAEVVVPLSAQIQAEKEDIQQKNIKHRGFTEKLQELQRAIYMQDVPRVYTLVMHDKTPVDDLFLEVAEQFLKEPHMTYSEYKNGVWVCAQRYPTVNEQTIADIIHRILRMGKRLV